MTPLRPATSRRLRRVAYLTTATAMFGATFAFAAPGLASATPSVTLSPGSLLVSTSEYVDVPSITAGQTALPINSTEFNISAVTTSGSGPYTVTITTGTSKNAYVPGQTVVIAGVGGATGVNGTQVIQTAASTSFTISLASAPGTYTSGGTVTGDIAIAGNQYPQVFNNDLVDANFGITEPIFLDQIPATTSLTSLPSNPIEVPNSDTNPGGNQLVTSFSSKSELALNQSTDGQYVSFMGYDAPTGTIDASNANTPNEQDTTNTDTANSGAGYYRDAAVMDASGNFQFTETGAYGGNNGRAAVYDPSNGALYMAGNAGNGGKPSYKGVVVGAGSQITTEAGTTSEATQDASLAAPTPYGNFNITQLGDTADKATKDNNFRGLTQYNGVIYMTKGSGSNGVNTVFFVDTTGQACPSGGIGVPQSGASLPSASSWAQTSNPLYPQFYNGSTANGLQENTSNPGLTPTNMCVLKGFSTTLASATTGTVYYPFGLWFANPTTLYVADEGSGAGGSTDTTGGLQKWTLDTSNDTWMYQYTLTSGLNLQQPYSVDASPAGINGGAAGQTYPTGTNAVGGKSGNWAPATDGLRNIVGQVNGDGTVTIWATTSTISGSGDQGADPNQVVAVTDSLSATGPTAPTAESFSQVLAPTDGVVYRGVSFTPTTPVPNVLPEVPWAPMIPVAGGLILGGYLWLRNRRRNAAGLVVG